MRSLLSRAGLMLGATAVLCAFQAHADDLRTQQVLLDSGVFLAHAETTAAFARLDADRSSAVSRTMTFYESGALDFGQPDSTRRLGYGGSATQMRIGADREVADKVVVGGMAAAGFGSISSGDLGAQTMGTHLDAYARFGDGPLFAKALAGASIFDFRSIGRGDDDARCYASTRSTVFRAAGQLGARATFAGISWSPSIDLAGYSAQLSGYRERDGADPLTYGNRNALAALGSLQIRGAHSVKVSPNHKVDLEGYLGAEEMLVFRASSLKAVDAGGDRVPTSSEGSPNGRGVFGGVGLGTALAPGVAVKFNYDYGLRDHIATYASKARLAIAF